MLDRHEQQLLFDAAFDAFWRDPKLLEQLMLLLLPKISGRGDEAGRAARQPAGRSAGAAAAAAAAEPGQPQRAAKRSAVRHQLHVLRPRAAAAGRLREHDDGRVRARQEARRGAAAAGRSRCAGAATRSPRAARLDLRATMLRMARQPHTLAPAFTRPRARTADAGRAARHLRVDGALRAPAAALRARPDAALPARAHADLRHAADQHHAQPEAPRPRRRRCGRPTARCTTGRAARASRRCLDEFNHRWARRLLGAQRRRAADDRRARPRRSTATSAALPRSCAATRTRSSGSTRCCASTASSRGPPACARCCRTSTASCRCTTSRAWPTSAGRCARAAVGRRAVPVAGAAARPTAPGSCHRRSSRLRSTDRSHHGTARRTTHSGLGRPRPGPRSTTPRC